jgi:DNA-binding NtrC family response regulator
MANILVVDDELGIRDLLSEILNDEGHNVELAENAAQARAARVAWPDLVLLDIWMPDTDGVTLLKEWSTTGLLTMPVIMMSGHATIDTAVEATKHRRPPSWKSPSPCKSCCKAVEQGLASRNGGRKPGQPNAVLARPTWTADGRHDRRPEPAPRGGNGPPGPPAVRPGPPLREARDAFEKSYFEFHLAKEGGSMTRVAEKTGLERTHLYRKLKQLGVDLSRNKRGA